MSRRFRHSARRCSTTSAHLIVRDHDRRFRPSQRRAVVLLVACGGVGAGGEEDAHHEEVAVPGGGMEGGVAGLCFGAGVGVAAARQQPLHAPLRPVTPEVAGSSPVGPANLKLSCAATSRRFVFSEGRLENWRLAKSLARSRISRAKFCADPRPKRRNVSHFGVECSTEKTCHDAHLKASAEARARPGRRRKA